MTTKPMRSMRERVSDAEWDVRVNLAACYSLVAKYGMTDLIYNHITAGSGYGLLEWPTLLRSLERLDPSYRD